MSGFWNCLFAGRIFPIYRKAQETGVFGKGQGTLWRKSPKSSGSVRSGLSEASEKEEQEWRDRQKVWDDTMSDMEDYYAAWVHQIKAPIAVMQVLLQQEDTEQNRELKAELFRVEQYAEMALSYVRLNERGGGFDLVAAEYALDPVIRKAIRKYASQFIRKRSRWSIREQMRLF